MKSVKRRLLPLLLANLVMGLMFHYSIVFPYMQSLGFSTSQLISYVVITNLVVMLVEIPSGILADRWSRKGVLILSLVFMTLGCIFLGNADNFTAFMIATAFTGLYYGMSSGVQAAMLYDLLLENNLRHNYEKWLGYLRSIHTVGLIIGSLGGAILASSISFHVPFYISAVSCVMALGLVACFKEPRLHKQVETAHLLKHLKSLVRLLTTHPETRLLVVTNIIIGVVFCFMLEVDPLWPLALGLATIWYGPLNALLLSSQGLAGMIAGVASIHLKLISLLSLGVIVASLGLTIHNIYVVILSEFALLTVATTLMIILSGRIQDTLPSAQRSGAESAISTVSTLSFIAVLPLFSYVARLQSVFAATWILVIISLLAFIGLNRSFRPTESYAKIEP